VFSSTVSSRNGSPNNDHSNEPGGWGAIHGAMHRDMLGKPEGKNTLGRTKCG